MGNIISIWVLEGTITSLQVALQEELSARHSGRLGPWPGICGAATLSPRPPDMQESGPKETGTRGQLLTAWVPGDAQRVGTVHSPYSPTARAVDSLGRKTGVVVGVGVGRAHLPQKSLRTATRSRDRLGWL